MDPPNLVVHLDNRAAAVASWGPVLHINWRRLDGADTVAAADAGLDAMARRYAGARRLFYVNRMPPNLFTARRDPSMRQQMVRHFERNEARVGAAAVAIECGGFAGSLCRSIAAGVMMARGSRVPTTVVDEVAAGLRWLAARAGADNAFDVDAMVAALRAAGHLDSQASAHPLAS